MAHRLKIAFLFFTVLFSAASLASGAMTNRDSGSQKSIEDSQPLTFPSRVIPDATPRSSIGAGEAVVFQSPEYDVLSYRIHRVNSNRFCLTSRLIGERVALRLQQHGISPKKEENPPGYPHLEVNITLNDTTFLISLDLHRMPVDSPNLQKNSVVSWNREALGAHDYDLDIILDSLDHLLAIFLDRYLNVNQSLIER